MSDVNEAGWYKSRFKPNTPAVIVLRILASLRLEPDSELKVSYFGLQDEYYWKFLEINQR